jgi:pimeloyl-ACP methyl ester carboxylesterase
VPVPAGLPAHAVSARSIVYLHGFASSPRSSKARFVAERAEAAGLPFLCPDLNAPDFRSLTVSRMIEQANAAIDALPDPVALVGSSLGAFVAVHAAAGRDPAARPRVDRVVLLAPAFDLVPGLEEEFGPDRMQEWETGDRLDVFHYGENATRVLGWGFMADARRYDAFAVQLQTPTLIYQGTADEVVSPDQVRRWASSRPWVTLRLVDDGHQLLGHLEAMWADIARFLGGEA